jgi:hypothetical protein
MWRRQRWEELEMLRRLPVVLATALLLAGLGAPIGASAITPSECAAQVNDTPSKLLPCIQTDDLWNHMKAFQAIADANPSPADGHPSRNSGEPGYKASADYVAQKMTDAGYDVTIQTYTFTYYAYTAPPTMSEVSPVAHDYGLNTAASSSRRRPPPARRVDARPLTSAASCRAGSP